jgi:hypothetical protein
MEHLDFFYRKILESLKLLAMPFGIQKKCFEDFVDAPFEVLDTFDNAFLHLPELIEDGRFLNMEIASLLRLHNMIDFTASRPELKDLDEDQFSTHVSWNRIRAQAKELLLLLGEPIGVPDKNYI